MTLGREVLRPLHCANSEAALTGAVIDVARRFIDARCVGVYRLLGTVEIDHIGAPDRAVDVYREVSANHSDPLITQVALTSAVLHEGDIGIPQWKASEVYKEAARPFGLEHYLAGPLIVGGALCGVITAARGPKDAPFSAAEVATWSALCIHASTSATRVRYRTCDEPAVHLSPREHDIAELVARGLSNQEIATVLHVSVNTVKTVLKAVFEKSGVSRRAELAWRLR